MFTGIISVVGRVERTEARGPGLRLVVRPLVETTQPGPGGDAAALMAGGGPGVGDSIAVNGCCLTLAASAERGDLAFDVVRETLDKTTLGELRPGAVVHLEPSATMGTLLGGHLVQGHVDGVAVVERVQETPGDWRVWLRPPPDLMAYVVPKGSIAIDGVSLTIAGVDPNAGSFYVALIPTTLAKTSLGDLKAGSRCNIECDAIAKTVVHYLRHYRA
ncbi:MAG: riboflavin synthase [Planctomycetota bacterium]|nr:riboflavin synthase [Planctomycetota bacterium]